MLFNSYAFVFVFLPLTIVGFQLVGRARSQQAMLTWIIASSVLFYGLSNPVSLAIIAPSIAVNFALARWIGTRSTQDPADRFASLLLTVGIVFNVCFLGYFKYRNFFLESVNELAGGQWPLTALFLPLGISFITFQKIAFLVDVRRRNIKAFSALDYLVFVFFFPQLIAGPIVQYQEMMPQFARIPKRLSARNLAVGLSLFSIGLFKKVVLADGVGQYTAAPFLAAEQGQHVGLVVAWLASSGYTLQLYFDFSGYSDMALGLARLLGITLPANFNSPLKSSSIIEFWSRWHITLTRFITSYIYTPLVVRMTRSRKRRGRSVLTLGNRSLGVFLALVAWPTIATMLLSGLWHGAGNTFVLWGLLQGFYLTVNRAWRFWRPKWDRGIYERVMKPLGFCITFVAIVFAMALFRAETAHGGGRLIAALLGFGGVSLPESVFPILGRLGDLLVVLGVQPDLSSASVLLGLFLWVLGLFVIAIGLPNSLEVMGRFEPALGFAAQPSMPEGSTRRLRFAFLTVDNLNVGWAIIVGVTFAAAAMGLHRASQFLYWQF